MGKRETKKQRKIHNPCNDDKHCEKLLFRMGNKFNLSSEVQGFGVAGRHGGVAPQKQVMHGRPDDLTATNHHGILPRHRDA